MKKTIVIALFALALIGIGLSFYLYKPVDSLDTGLKIYGQKKDDSSAHTILPFSFTNQLGQTITNKTLDGQIYVANFFFATCQGPCPSMQAKMKQVYKTFEGVEHLYFVSHTVDPYTDTVALLKRYADSLQINSKQWFLLTSDDDQKIYDAGTKSYLLVTQKADYTGGKVTDDNTQAEPEHKYLHSQLLVLVDTKGRIRGFYDSFNEDDMNSLKRDINILYRLAFKKAPIQ